MAQQTNPGLGRFVLEVSISHTIGHTHTPGRFLRTSDRLVAEAATYTTHNKHKGRTSMPSAGFEPTIPAIKQLQTYAFDRTATGIGLTLHIVCLKYKGKFHSIIFHEGTEVEWRYSSTLSLTSALDGGGWSTPCLGRFIPGEETRYPLYGRLGGPQDQSGRVWKISPSPGFDPRTVQPVASRTD